MLTPRRLRSLAVVALPLVAACSSGTSREPPRDRGGDQAIADTLRALVVRAYDFSDTNVVARFMSLYPAAGRVVSGSGGRVTTSRDTVRLGIQRFYDRVARNMRQPAWEWGPMYVDVLSPDAAVLTAEYSVPHRTPEGAPHTISGAWTAVFARRGGKWVVIQEHLSDAPGAP